MKGKITIVFLSLVLVFGMIAASCDNDTYPDNPYWKVDPNNKKEASDWKRSPVVPKTTSNASMFSDVIVGLVDGTTYNPTALPTTSVLTFVGSSSLKNNAGVLEVVTSTSDNWGGGVDIKVNVAGGITLRATDKITIKGTSPTKALYIRLKNGDYNNDIAIAAGATFEKTVELTAASIAAIKESENGCIRIGCGGDDSYTFTVTDVILARDSYDY
jgi:hypothetical protein